MKKGMSASVVFLFMVLSIMFVSNVSAGSYTVGEDIVNSTYKFADYERPGYATFPANTDVEWRYDTVISGVIDTVKIVIGPQWAQGGGFLNPIYLTDFIIFINGESMGWPISRVGESLRWGNLLKLVDEQQVVFELWYDRVNPYYYALGLRYDDVDDDGKIEFHGDLGTDYQGCPPYNGVYDYGDFEYNGHPAADYHDVAYEFTYSDIPNNPPNPEFTYSPSNPTTQNIIQFIDSSSDIDGTILYWSWAFGDGATSNQQHPTHRYEDNGEYAVTLAVVDDDYSQNSISKYIIIRNVPPEADFTYHPSNPTTEDTIQFTDTSTDIDGTINSWSWDFGDDFSYTKQNPQYKYSTSGTYTISFEITDNDGDTDSISKIITIQESPTEEPTDEEDSGDDDDEEPTDEETSDDDNGDETNEDDTNNDNTGDTTRTPGFELILVLCTIALIVIWKQKQSD